MTAMQQHRSIGAVGQLQTVKHLLHSRHSIRIIIACADRYPQHIHNESSNYGASTCFANSNNTDRPV